jgi:uncharacterized membrane protein HdeD (DUF308 family)
VQTLLVVYFALAIGASVVLAVIAAVRAPAKGRRRWVWALCGLLFGVFALIALARLPTADAQPPAPRS